MRIAILLLAVAASPASAQVVSKCVGTDGHVTFTSEPCKPHERLESSVHAPPERLTPQRREELERRRRQGEADSAYLNQLAGFERHRGARNTRRSRETDRQAQCQAAKANRDAVLTRIGLKRTYDLLRRLDDQVYDACK